MLGNSSTQFGVEESPNCTQLLRVVTLNTTWEISTFYKNILWVQFGRHVFLEGLVTRINAVYILSSFQHYYLFITFAVIVVSLIHLHVLLLLQHYTFMLTLQ